MPTRPAAGVTASTSLGPATGSPAVAERAQWATAVAPLLGAHAEVLWRTHCDAVNSALVRRWLPPVRWARVLKTDLWDEALGQGLQPLLAGHADSVTGIDFIPAVAAAATARHPQLRAVLADVRRLPFAAAAFDAVVSTSTLDHFAAGTDIVVALRELQRVLRPGGQLVMTLDNRANPVVALRNALPFRLLHQAGLVPYPVGATCGPRRLRRIVREAGFDVLETTALLHCPRVLAIAAARRLQRAGDAAAGERYLARLHRWEKLARMPTRFLSGYFIGVHARRR
jgi:SAM-dependent methyltransferase